MIRFPDGELLDLLPSFMKNDSDMVCLSYAIKEVTRELLETLKTTRALFFIENAPEKILDVLAVELKSPYYTQDLPVETKRDIVSRTLEWHTRAGTPAAVEELVQSVFGEGEVTEWYDFTDGDRTPGLFDIETNATLEEDMIGKIDSLIGTVKNERSHLRRVHIRRKARASPTIACAAYSYGKVTITNGGWAERSVRTEQLHGAGAFGIPHIVIAEPGGRERTLHAAAYGGAAHIAVSKMSIT